MSTPYQPPQLAQPAPEPTNQLLNTQPANQMHPDKAMASLAFSTHLLNQLLQHHAPAEPQTAPQEPQNAPQPSNPKAEPQTPAKPENHKETDTNAVSKLSDVISMLTSDISKKYESKFAELEQHQQQREKELQDTISKTEEKHQQEISAIKDEIQGIINE